jgi:hypothetical protein
MGNVTASHPGNGFNVTSFLLTFSFRGKLSAQREGYGLGQLTKTQLLGHMHHWYLYEGRSYHVICC